MLVLVTLTGPVASIIFDPRPFAASAPLILINTIWLPALTIAVGVVVSAVRSSEEVLAALTDQVTDEEIAAAAAEQEEQRIRREVASRLHGSVQSRLLAAAGLMRQPGLLQQAGISDPALLLQDLADSVDLSMDVDERSLQERIAAITRPWSSLMAITLSITGEVDSRFATSIVRVIEETLTNAFRHGNATVVDISITEAVSAVDVTVTDNGSGPSPRLAQGLGSQILSTVGEWDMAALPTGGTCVRVTIPLTLD
jgi:signal transduction histidine kinase